MNWGDAHPSRRARPLALAINAPERHPLHRIGGGNYTHSSLGQSIIIIDESRQNPVPAKVTGYDIEGPVQFVQARPASTSPARRSRAPSPWWGSTSWCWIASAATRPRTVDWCLRYPGRYADRTRTWPRACRSTLEHRKGSFTDKPSDTAHGVNFGASLKSDGYFTGTTAETWRQSKGRMVMAGGAIHAGDGLRRRRRRSPPRRRNASTGVPVLMARRAGVRQTDFVAAFSPKVKDVEQVAVTRADGKPADAVGVEVTLEDGKTFRAIANFEPEGVEVRLGSLQDDAAVRDRLSERVSELSWLKRKGGSAAGCGRNSDCEFDTSNSSDC